MKRNLQLVFDFETDVSVIGPERMKKVGLLGLGIGALGLAIGVPLTLALAGWIGSFNRLSGLPAMLGIVLFANGCYRLLVGFVPVIARVAVLRMGVMLLLLCLIVAPILLFLLLD